MWIPKEELIELQERLKVYSSTSKFQVNYPKSVAFLLAGRSTFNDRELKELSANNGFRWVDTQS